LKNYLGLILVLILQIKVNSQDVVKGFVADKITKRPVGFSTIKFLNLPEGTFSDSSGMFEIPYLMKNDSVIVSSIGYFSKRTLLRVSDTIFLDAKILELNPVIVKKRNKIATEEFGIKKVKSDFKWGPSGFGDEFAQKIFININEEQVALLKKVILKAKYFNPDKPVLLHIYSADFKTGLPGEELLTHSYFITQNNFKGNKVIVDIEKENLLISDKYVYVSFEWLGTSFQSVNRDKGLRSLLLMTTDSNTPQTYSRTNKNKSNQWFPAPAVLPNQKNPTNTIFSVVADILY
jgi:hypothetical protein